MTAELLAVAIPLAVIGGFGLGAYVERLRQQSREGELLRLVGPSPDEVDARIEAHWRTLPASLKGDHNAH